VDPFDEPAGPDAGRVQSRRYDGPMCESIPQTAAVVERYTPQPINPAYQADEDPAAVLAQRWLLGWPPFTTVCELRKHDPGEHLRTAPDGDE
jgi:hypothetical protein